MTHEDFITDLFCRVDDQMKDVPQHSQAALWPSEVVTLGLLFAIKGVGERAFYRWISRNHRALFPHLPERTRFFRRLKTHWKWTLRFLARPSLLGIVDSYGIELIHPVRRGRSPQQFGAAGISNHRWIAGAKWCVCQRGERNDRMLIETVLSMLTVVCHAKKMRHRLASYFQTHVGLMVAAFNLLVSWFGLQANVDGFVPLSIAEFSL